MDLAKQSGVYEIVNSVNGKRYVGSATRFCKRFSAHRCALRQGKHHSPKLQRAWDKHGEEAFVFQPLLVCLNDRPTLLAYEQACVDKFAPEYNIALAVDNAMRGRQHKMETRDRISRSLRGRVFSPQTIDRMRTANVGRFVSDATRLKHSENMRGNKRAAGSTGRLGSKASAETINKLRVSHTGKKQSAATKAKRAASMLASWAIRRAP